MENVELILNIDNDIDKYKLYDDLMYYKNQSIKVRCEYMGVNISKDIDNKDNQLNHIRISSTHEEYIDFLKELERIKSIYNKVQNKVNAPIHVKFIVEKTVLFIDDFLLIEKFEDECYNLYNKNKKSGKAINIASYVYIASKKMGDEYDELLSAIEKLKIKCNDYDLAIARNLYASVFNNLDDFDEVIGYNLGKKLVRK